VRVQSIDVLRGVAILGILFMNIYYHGSLVTGYGVLTPKPFTDSAIEVINSIFFDGRFRTLFCLLFGAGLAIQYQSCQRKNISAKVFLSTRLNWLIIFGLLHGVFIFGGDILLMYGLCALTIINSLTLPLKKLYKKSIKFLSIGIVLTLALTLLIVFFAEDAPMMRGSAEYQEMHKLWFSGYGYQVLLQGGVAFGLILLSPLFIYWQIAGLMMLGAFLYRVGFFKKGFSHRQLITVSVSALTLTCLETIFISTTAISGEVASVVSSISAIFVALLYAHIVIALLKNKTTFISLLSAPGKIAFSLYIFQSIAMAILLRFWHQDFHLTAQRIDYVVIALIFTLIQIALAHWYLRYFTQGPLEYIWRKAYRSSLNKKMHQPQKLDNANIR